MMTRRIDDRPPWELVSYEFVGSEEFTVAYLSALLLVVLGLPLLWTCLHHVSQGRVILGCSHGVVGLLVVEFAGWKLIASLRKAQNYTRPN